MKEEKNMKKRTISLMLVGAMVATMFAGCGNSGANTNVSSTETGKTGGAEAGNVSISFYTTETGKDDMFQELIADFEEKNPGITVEYIAAGDDQLQQWMALYSSNEGPTVSLMDPINIYENQERMRDLTNEPLIDNIEESALATMTFDGKIYAAPGTAATCITGVNWSVGAHYLCQSYGAAIGSTDERVAYVNSIISGDTKEIDNDVFNGYMDTFDLLAEYNYNKADPLVGDVNMDAQALATGACGTWFMGDWAWTYLADIVEDGAEFGLLPIPHSDDASDVINQSIPTSYAKGYCVDASQNTEEQQEAGVKFIEYLTSDATAEQIMAKTCGQALPYKNADVTIESPLGLSTAGYISKGLTYDFYGTPNLCPSDIWYECGAYMCEYLAGACDRETLASELDAYWQKQEAR